MLDSTVFDLLYHLVHVYERTEAWRRVLQYGRLSL